MMRRIPFRWVGLLLAGAACLGCAAPLPPGAARNLNQALEAYRDGDDQAVCERAGRVIAAYAAAQEAGEAHYLRGLALLRQDDPAGLSDLRRSLELTRREDLAGKAHLALGLLADAGGDASAAGEHYTGALELLAGGPRTRAAHEHALFRLACLHQRQGDFLEADRHFDRLLHLYGQGRWADDARARIRARCWTLLAGVFDSADAARRLADELGDAGQVARVASIGPPVCFAVCVGRYETRAQADEALKELALPDAAVTVMRH